MNWMKDLNKNIQSLRTDACIQKKQIVNGSGSIFKKETTVKSLTIKNIDAGSCSQDLINLNMICRSANNYSSFTDGKNGISLDFKQKMSSGSSKKKRSSVECFSSQHTKSKRTKIEKEHREDSSQVMQSFDDSSALTSSYPKLISSYKKQSDNCLMLKPTVEDREENFDLFSSNYIDSYNSSQLFNKSQTDSGFDSTANSSCLTANSYFDENMNLLNDNVNIFCRIQSQIIENNENKVFRECVELFRNIDDNQVIDDRSFNNSNNNELLATTKSSSARNFFEDDYDNDRFYFENSSSPRSGFKKIDYF